MYWAYSITLYCTVTNREYHIVTVKFVIPNHFHHSQYLYWLLTNREYHIVTVKFVIPNHFHHSQYLYWLLKSSWRCPVTQRCFLDMSMILCYSSMPSSDYLKMVGMNKFATLNVIYLFPYNSFIDTLSQFSCHSIDTNLTHVHCLNLAV